MARVPQIDYDNASEEAKLAHDEHLKIGKMTNMKRTLLNNVPSFKALMEWYTLRDEAAKFLTDLDISIYCYSISSENDCLICTTFFAKILQDNHAYTEDFEFTPVQDVLVRFGRQLVNDSHAVSDELFAQLKQYFNDEQLVVLTAFGAIMIATNMINTVLKVELDGYLEGYKK